MKKTLEKWQVLLLGALLFMADLQLTAMIGSSEDWLVAVLCVLLALVTAYVIWRGKLIKGNVTLVWWQYLLAMGLGLLAVYFFKILGAMLLMIEHGPDYMPNNQQAIMDAGMPPYLLFAFAVVLAPVIEEFVMRGLVMGKLFNPRSIWGLLISSFIFGLLHGPSDLGSWVMYGGMGLALGLVYRYTERLDVAIGVHALNNLIAFVLMMTMAGG